MSAIVLAGGRSARFGRDKLAEPFENRPLLQRAVEAVALIAHDVVVVGRQDADPALPPGARLVHDETAFEGPLAGTLTGLIAAREPLALVVGGDMPSLEPAVLRLLVRLLTLSAADAARLEYRGRPQQLPLALRTGAATDMTRRLVAEGERRMGALTERLSVRLVREPEWRALDPEALTLRDVDEPGDLPSGR